MPSDASAVIAALREAAVLTRLAGENAFKARAYDLAADRLTALTEPLSAYVSSGRLTEIPGVGAAIAQKIAELLQTGRCDSFERLKVKVPPSLITLTEIESLGPKKVMALYQQLGVNSVSSLETACRDGHVKNVPGFSERSQEKLLAILERRRQSPQPARRPLAAMSSHAVEVANYLRRSNLTHRLEIGGSIRRFRETVGDIDLVASSNQPAALLQHFTRFPGVSEVLGCGESKASVRLATDSTQIDLRVVPDADFATALHHCTGSQAHHVQLRGHALSLGYTLSEWGLFRGDQKMAIDTEEALYRALGLAYVSPELREGAGEFEMALSGTLPQSLVSAQDIRGAIHCHSTWSDGRNTLEEMALAAQRAGYDYLTVTEHSTSAGYARGLSTDSLRRQWDEIDELNQRWPHFRLLKGIESDILEDGRLDYPDAILAQLDVVIGSIHQRHGQSGEALTERVLRAFENPHFRIWGHPTGRLRSSREAADLDMDRLFARAAELGIAVEMNGCPDRMDLSAEHARAARRLGVRLVASTDAHGVADLEEHRRYAVGVARRAWLTPADVTNALPADAFLRQLRRFPNAHG